MKLHYSQIFENLLDHLCLMGSRKLISAAVEASDASLSSGLYS